MLTNSPFVLSADHHTKASVFVPAAENDARVIVAIHQAIISRAIQEGNACWAFPVEKPVEADPSLALDENGIPVQFSDWDLVALLDEADDLIVSMDECGLWLRDGGGEFPLSYAASLVREHLSRTHSDEVICWEYTRSATRPVLNGFGGGIVTVTARGYDILDTSALVEGQKTAAKNRMLSASDDKTVEDDTDLSL